MTIRSATPQDVPVVYDLVRKLAEYEKLSHAVVSKEEDFHAAMFPKNGAPVVEVLLALDGEKPVGFAMFFLSFSTFLGRPGLYLEDIFVEPEFRGRGFGAALMRRMAKIAVERNYGRMEWSVLTWNQPSIEFYERLGAVRLEDWRSYRILGDAMRKLAGGQGSGAGGQ